MGHRRTTELMRVLDHPMFRLERGEIEDPWPTSSFMPYAETAADPTSAANRPACSDPDDQILLDVPIAARADALVMGDRDPLGLAATAPVPILAPEDLRERFRLG